MEQIPLFDVLRRHASMIIALCVVAAVAGYGFSLLLPARYSASALVLVRPQQPIKLGAEKDNKEFLNFPMGGASAVETASKTYIEIVKSPAVVGEIVSKLGLDKEKAQEKERSKLAKLLPVYLTSFTDTCKEWLTNLIAVFKYGRVIEDEPFLKTVKDVSSNLTLETNLDTYTFDIKYVAEDPQQAADIANTTAKTLVRFVNELRVSEARSQGDHLKEEFEHSRQQVTDARERLERYKQAHSVFSYQAEYEAKLKVISELEVELAKAEAALVGSQNTLSNVSLAAKRARLIRSIEERKAELVSLPETERQFKQLEQDLTTALTAYDIVQKQIKQADINQSYAMPEVRVVSEAVAPRIPSSPARGTITLASLLAGLVVAVGLAFFLEYLNRRVRGIDDIEDLLGRQGPCYNPTHIPAPLASGGYSGRPSCRLANAPDDY